MGSADTPVTANAVESAAAKPTQTPVRLLMSGTGSVVEMLCRAGCDRQVLGGSLRPFSRIADRGFPKMQDRNAGTDKGPDRLVEIDQHGRRRIVRAQAIAAEQDLPDLVGADPFAFHRQKRELIHRVERPQVGPEFKAIDDDGRGSQTDVLGTKIAMPFHHPAVVEPTQQEVFTAI